MSTLANSLAYWHFDDHLMVFKDGSLGTGFKISGFDLSCATAEEINSFNRDIENIFLASNDGLRFQIYYDLRGDVGTVLTRHRDQSSLEEAGLDKVAQARLGFLGRNVDSNLYFTPAIHLFIRGLPYKYPRKKLFHRRSAYQTASVDEYQKHKDKFLRSLQQVESSLASARLRPQMLTSQDMFAMVFEKLNPRRSKDIGTPRLRDVSGLDSPSLNAQLCLTDLSCHKEGISIGGENFRVLTLKTLPEGVTYASMIDAFTKLPFHFSLSQNIEILDQGNERKKLELKRRIAHSMALGDANVSDLDSESKLEQIEELLRELLQGSTKLVSFDFNVLVWGSTDSELDDKCDEVLRAFRGLNQSEGVIETLPAMEAFQKSLPGVCEGLRHKMVKSSNATHLLPLFAPWPGNRRPVCLIPNRDGGLFSYDPFDEELPNWNGLCFGGSGSGKSFTLCQLMLMFATSKRRPRIIWMDNGASSKRIVENLGGEFIDFNMNSGIAINMFDLPEGESKPTPEKVKLILAVLELILKDEDSSGLPKRTKALLEEAIYSIYERCGGNTPTLGDFRAYLSTHPHKSLHECADILYSWTGDTAYGKVLDRPTNVAINKDLVTIEMQSLNSYSEFKNVIMLILTAHIHDLARGDLTREYQLVIDEAERLLSGESGKLARDFVVTCYRTWRKFRSSIICLSQNYLDFMADKELRDSLMPNTNNLIILRQRKIDWDDFQKTFDFNDAQVEAIKSLDIVKGKYSEFYLLQGENQAILRLVPEPLSYWLCTSDAADKTRIEEMKKKHPDLKEIDILEKLAFEDTDGEALAA